MESILKFFTWLIKKIGAKPLIVLPLLLVALASGAAGFANAIRGLDADFLVRLVLAAALLGWILARSRAPAWIAWLLMSILGVLTTIIVVGDLFLPLVALIRAGIYSAWQYTIFAWRFMRYEAIETLDLDLSTLALAYTEVYYGVAGILNTVATWAASLFGRNPFSDRIAISMVWGVVQWIAACWGGWFLRRRRMPILGLLPSGAMLTTALAYSGSETRILLPFVFSALMLMGLTYYYQAEDRWEEKRVDYPEDISKEAPLVTLGISAILLVLAAVIPAISVTSLTRFVREVSGQNVDNAKPVIQSFGFEPPVIEEHQKLLRGDLPRSHLIGSGPELSEQLVMTVQLSRSGAQTSEESKSLPLYWRMLTYDLYSGDGWESSTVSDTSFRAGKSVYIPSLDYHTVLQQDFRLIKNEAGSLYAVGDVLTVDTDFQILHRAIPRDSLVSGPPMDIFGGLVDEASYRVQSVVPVVSDAELRDAPTGFPDWIRERYLRLPESVPTRVLTLARGLTTNSESPYDRALIIEEYLRGFEYTLDVSRPPRGQDVADYFLFDLRKGYCDYFSTAMVVMARAVALPARLATGYYRGMYDEVNARYVVTEADAHSWVEIYFSGIGWVPFEPTPIRSEIERLPKHLAVIGGDDLESLESLEPRSLFEFPPLVYVGIGTGGLVALILIINALDFWNLQRMAVSKVVEKLYRRLYRHGRRLNVPARKGDTPYEFALSLERRLIKLSGDTIWRRIIYPAAIEVRDLTDVYTQVLFSSRTINIRERPKIFYLWRNLRRRLWLARLRQRFARKTEKP